MPPKGTKAMPRDAAVVTAKKTATGMKKKTKKKTVVSKRQRGSY
jgi:hypothetical protein